VRHTFIVYVFFPLILVVFTHVIPVDAILEIDNFGEQTHLECMKSVPSYGEITFTERKFALQACHEKRPDPYVANTDEIIGVAEKIIGFCENFEPIYRITSEFHFQVIMKWPHTRTCILLYETPIWSYQGVDRAKVLLNYVHDQRIKHLEETQDEREKSKIDARLRQGQIMFVVDLFQNQNKQIEFLEKQLEEKTELIVKNELVIQEQKEMIETLNQGIKNTALSINEKLLECLENADLKSLPVNEKIWVLQDCTKENSHQLIVIDDNKITKITEAILSFCQNSYSTYLEFGERIYFKSVQHAFANECLWIYDQPLWGYQGANRTEVLIEAGKPHVEQYINEKIAERAQSVYDAHMSKGRLMVMMDFYKFGEQKALDLENKISEKNDLISLQQQILLEQMNTIHEFYQKLSAL